jgi:hypothetical protein
MPIEFLKDRIEPDLKPLHAHYLKIVEKGEDAVRTVKRRQSSNSLMPSLEDFIAQGIARGQAYSELLKDLETQFTTAEITRYYALIKNIQKEIEDANRRQGEQSQIAGGLSLLMVLLTFILINEEFQGAFYVYIVSIVSLVCAALLFWRKRRTARLWQQTSHLMLVAEEAAKNKGES